MNTIIIESKHGYLLANGKMVFMTILELKKYLIDNQMQLHQPSYQGDSIESEQVGIKSY